MDEDPIVLGAFYRSDESCDNGHTASGDTYAAQYSLAHGNDDNYHVHSSAALLGTLYIINIIHDIQCSAVS